MPSGDFNANEACEPALRLGDALAQHQTERVVFAESCTAGMACGLLGQVPGISQWLCGSAVTYRLATKQQWLGVSEATLASHTAESQETTSEMALGALNHTGEATISAAITGHLGPDAPTDIDGLVFIAVARRMETECQVVATQQLRLVSATRIGRQREAAESLLDITCAQIQ